MTLTFERIMKMKVVELRAALRQRSLEQKGRKSELQDRLVAALKQDAEEEQQQAESEETSQPQSDEEQQVESGEPAVETPDEQQQSTSVDVTTEETASQDQATEESGMEPVNPAPEPVVAEEPSVSAEQSTTEIEQPTEEPTEEVTNETTGQLPEEKVEMAVDETPEGQPQVQEPATEETTTDISAPPVKPAELPMEGGDGAQKRTAAQADVSEEPDKKRRKTRFTPAPVGASMQQQYSAGAPPQQPQQQYPAAAPTQQYPAGTYQDYQVGASAQQYPAGAYTQQTHQYPGPPDESNLAPILLEKDQENIKKFLQSVPPSDLLALCAQICKKYPAILKEIKGKLHKDPKLCKLFIRGLDWETTSETLHKVFSEYGTVVEANVIMDKLQHGRSKGYGFITMGTAQEAQKALETVQRKIDGRITHINLASQRNNGGYNNFRGGGRGGYRQQQMPYMSSGYGYQQQNYGYQQAGYGQQYGYAGQGYGQHYGALQ